MVGFANTFRDKTDFNFDVQRERLQLSSGVDTGVDALVRQDTGRVLSIVTPKYRVTTHKEANTFTERLLERSGLSYDEGHISVNNSGTRFMREFRFSDKSFIPGSVQSTAQDYEGTEDTFVPTLLLRNSYDRSSTLEFVFGAFRMVCSNGMIVPRTVVSRMSFKHTEYPNYDRISAELIDKLEQTVTGFKDMYASLNSEAANPYLQLLMQKHLINHRVAKILMHMSKGEIGFNIDDKQVVNGTVSSNVSAYFLYNLMTEIATHRMRKYSRSVDAQQKIAKIFS